MRIVRRDRFSEDVIAAWAYIAIQSPRAAETFLERVEAAVALVSVFPEGRPERDDISPPVRTMRAKGTRYVLVYRISEDQLNLLRLIHSARDFPGALAED